jgi:hypothetical protein
MTDHNIWGILYSSSGTRLNLEDYCNSIPGKDVNMFLPMRITRMKRGTTMNGIIFTISSLKNKNSSGLRQGTGIKFRNRLETVSVIPRRKMLIPTSEAFRGPWKSQFSSLERNRTKRNYGKKLV